MFFIFFKWVLIKINEFCFIILNKNEEVFLYIIYIILFLEFISFYLEYLFVKIFFERNILSFVFKIEGGLYNFYF